VRTARYLLLSLLLVVIGYQLSQHGPTNIPIFLLNMLVIMEVYFHYKVSKVVPSLPVEKNNGKDIFQSFTRQALYGFVTENKTSKIMKNLLRHPQIDLILEKADILHKDLVMQDLDKNLLAQSAFDVARTFRGKFVTTIDVFVAYLFLTEKDTKLLFAKQLKTEDLYNLLYWVRLEHPEEETPKKLRVRFTGQGIGEELVSGWTPETKKYTANFTANTLREEPLLRGREAEFQKLLEGLVKVENNNILLVGDIGAGKENLVKSLAYHSFEGHLIGFLNHKRVLQLLVGSFTAGAQNRDDLETRLQNIIAEVSHANDVIIYIPDFQNILGGTSYNLDLSGAILPYLKTGNLPVIATMTMGAYKTFMERNPLKEAFNTIVLNEPDKNTAMQMVLGDARKLEKKYRIIISYRAIASAVELADRYYQDEVLPGSAVTVLENVANSVALDKKEPYFDHTRHKIVLESHIVRKMEETMHVAIGLPTGKEIQLLLHLEEQMHKQIITQDAAVSAIAEALRRVRSGMKTSERPISFLFLGPTGVGKTETAKTLANLYYGGVKNMIRLDMSEYTDQDALKRLLGAPPGQGNERGELTDKIHDNPASLILLDEFEKANPMVHNLFLQVLDDGRLTDNKGVTVSFRDSIIIATSNAGSEFIREAVEKKTPIDKNFQRQLLNYLQTKAIFKPELLNRFDDIITFTPLSQEQVGQVVRLLLNDFVKTLQQQDITLAYDDAVVEKIIQEGFDPEFGARPLRRYIQDTLEDAIAQKRLSNEIKRGSKVVCFISGTGAIAFTVS
jgi:ATP-dependent Clp protease ATP-binding subunit ClpC